MNTPTDLSHAGVLARQAGEHRARTIRAFARPRGLTLAALAFYEDRADRLEEEYTGTLMQAKLYEDNAAGPALAARAKYLERLWHGANLEAGAIRSGFAPQDAAAAVANALLDPRMAAAR
jgi:hypothetical protein